MGTDSLAHTPGPLWQSTAFTDVSPLQLLLIEMELNRSLQHRATSHLVATLAGQLYLKDVVYLLALLLGALKQHTRAILSKTSVNKEETIIAAEKTEQKWATRMTQMTNFPIGD